jgi:hypothetical protein
MTRAAAISALTRLSDGVRLDQRTQRPQPRSPARVDRRRAAAGDRPVLVQPHCGCQIGDVNAQPDPTPSYGLAPLRWVADEDLLYDPRSRRFTGRAVTSLASTCPSVARWPDRRWNSYGSLGCASAVLM